MHFVNMLSFLFGQNDQQSTFSHTNCLASGKYLEGWMLQMTEALDVLTEKQTKC